MEKVAVVILNYNSAEDCARCCADLDKQTGVELEIILVDNCSPRSEDTEQVRQLCEAHGYTFIAAEHNGGYNAGNNIGLRYAADKGYRYALIANPDMQFPQPDYIARLVAEMAKDKDIAVCCSDIVGLDGRHQNPMKGMGGWSGCFNWLPAMLGLKKKSADSYDFIDRWQETHYCKKASGCCLLIDLAFARSIGFFDEGVFLYCEESILSKQVENAGKKMYYTADTQAVHAHHNSSGGNKLKQMHTLRRSRIYFIRQHSGFGFIGRSISILSEHLQYIVFSLGYRVKLLTKR